MALGPLCVRTATPPVPSQARRSAGPMNPVAPVSKIRSMAALRPCLWREGPTISFPPGLAEGKSMGSLGEASDAGGPGAPRCHLYRAGMSTDSGILDFRGAPSGLWTLHEAHPFDDFLSLRSVPALAPALRRYAGPGGAQCWPLRRHGPAHQRPRALRANPERRRSSSPRRSRSERADRASRQQHVFATCLSCGQRYELAALKGSL